MNNYKTKNKRKGHIRAESERKDMVKSIRCSENESAVKVSPLHLWWRSRITLITPAQQWKSTHQMRLRLCRKEHISYGKN